MVRKIDKPHPTTDSLTIKKIYMIKTKSSAIDKFMQLVERRNPGQTELIQAVSEVAQVIVPYIDEHPEYKKVNILERIIEAERVLIFRVPWVDDKGNFMVNRGYRIQMKNAIGPYKGGLGFHP